MEDDGRTGRMSDLELRRPGGLTGLTDSQARVHGTVTQSQLCQSSHTRMRTCTKYAQAHSLYV